MPSIYDRLTYDILSKLASGTGKKRFRDLLPLAPKATLAIRLKELEKREYVKREVLSTRPITTEYSITSLGKKLLEYSTQQYLEIVAAEMKQMKELARGMIVTV